MNDEQVFFKTPAGEDAVRERTRLVQRNLRMVLILVDGVIDAAALKNKVGDAAMVDSALAELNRMGLIETAEVRAARTAGAETTTGGAQPTEPEMVPAVIDSDEIPVLNEVASAATESIEAPLSQSPSIFSQKPLVDVPFDHDIWADDNDRPVVQSVKPPLLASIKTWWQSRQRKRADAHEEALFEKAYVEASVEEAPVVIAKPPARPRERKIKLGPILAVTAMATVVLGISRLVFYPYDEYRPEFERRLSRMLDDTVKIGNVRVGFIPWPVISLERVSVGTAVYANIDAVRIVPEPWTLIAGRQQYQQVVVEGMRIQDSGIARLGHWFLPGSMEDVRLDKFEVTGLSVGLGRGSLDGLSGRAELDEQRGLARLIFRAKEGDFQVEAVPAAPGVLIAARATEWKAPFQLPLALSTFDLTGKLLPGRLAIDKLEAQAYEGQVSGNGTIGWERDANMSLTLNLQHLAAGKLLPALGAPPLVDGDIAGRIVLAANAPTVNRLESTMRIEGRFNVSRGNLKRFDLAGALRQDDQGTGTVRGGSTAFEDFSGTLAIDSRTVRLGGLRLSSGLLQAGGQASVLRESGTIAGGANVEMRSSTGTIRSPVGIAGNIADPELKMNR